MYYNFHKVKSFKDIYLEREQKSLPIQCIQAGVQIHCSLNVDTDWASPVSDKLLWVVTWVWGAPCCGMNKRSKGSQYCCWKKWLFSLQPSMFSLLLAQVFLCCLGNWSRKLYKSGQVKGLQWQWFPPDHWKLQHKGGSKPWVREYFLPSKAMQVFSSLRCVCTLSCVVCVWLEGYQSGLGYAWDVRNILLNGRVEDDLEVHAWWVHWSRINSFRQA